MLKLMFYRAHIEASVVLNWKSMIHIVQRLCYILNLVLFTISGSLFTLQGDHALFIESD